MSGDGACTALAAVTYPDGHTSVSSYDLPDVSPDTGLLRVEASGVCGTDVSMVRTRSLQHPTVLGHHVVGRVDAVGPRAARRWGVSAGELVAVQEYLPCRSCTWCHMGEYRFCDRADLRRRGRRFGTVPVDEPPALWGGNAQALHLPAEALVHRLPQTMGPARAVWLLPLANAFDWTLEAGRLDSGATVVVIGPGQHGLTCVTAAREAGAGQILVVGVDGDEERLVTAERLGADHTVVAATGSMKDSVLGRLNGSQVDLVVNTSGAGPDLLPVLVSMAGKHARVVEAGLVRGEAPSLDMAAVTAHAIGVVGARGRSLKAIDRAIASLDTAGDHPLDAVPTCEMSLEEVDTVLRPGASHPHPRPVHSVIRPWAGRS